MLTNSPCVCLLDENEANKQERSKKKKLHFVQKRWSEMVRKRNVKTVNQPSATYLRKRFGLETQACTPQVLSDIRIQTYCDIWWGRYRKPRVTAKDVSAQDWKCIQNAAWLS